MANRRQKPGILRRIADALVGAGDAAQPVINRIVRTGPGARAYFDAADSNRYTSNHFAASSNSDVNAILRADLPRLRQWCRYEGHNNSYARGIIETLGNDIVGQGPRVQVTIPGADADDATGQRIEDAWSDWCEDCDADGRMNFGQMMALGIKQCPTAGESFVVMVNDAAAARRRSGVALRLRLIEGDRVSTPYGLFGQPGVADGIKTDATGRPTHYIILKNHPGDSSALGLTNPSDYDEVPSDQVVHIYRPERPSQRRGIPWFASALVPLAHLRRYTLATVTAAENSASITAIIYTELPGVEVEEAEAFEEVEIPRGSMMTMPAGYKGEAFHPEQPTSTYSEFKNEILDEIGRSLSMPHNVVAGNSSGYNYASGRLDWQTYFRMIRTDQAWISRLCGKIFQAWYAEYAMTSGVLPIGGMVVPDIAWYWPGHEHVDPVKEANAQRIRLNSLCTTLEDEWAKKGQDWVRKLHQIHRERTLLVSLGLTIEDSAPAIIDVQTSADAAEDDDESQKDNNAKSKTSKKLAVA